MILSFSVPIEDPISAEKDLYNIKKTRNVFNTDEKNYNCMGYALETYSWICPYEKDSDHDEYIEGLCYDYNMDFDAVAEVILKEYVDWILERFPNVRICNKKEIYHLKKNEYAIAMRTYVDEDYENSYNYEDEEYNFVPDFDFHFLKFEDGLWTDKPGGNDIRETPREKWYNSNEFEYNSKTQYFIVSKS